MSKHKSALVLLDELQSAVWTLFLATNPPETAEWRAVADAMVETNAFLQDTDEIE